MLVFFSGRRLKGGHWDEFRKAWGAAATRTPSGLPEGSVVYHARNIKDEDEVISFGIFDVDRDSLDVDPRLGRGRGRSARRRSRQHVHDIPLEGVYEVVEELRP